LFGSDPGGSLMGPAASARVGRRFRFHASSAWRIPSNPHSW